MAFSLKSIKTETKELSPTQAIADSHKRKTNLLQDNSWIRQGPREDRSVAQDPNKEVFSHLKAANKNASQATERNQFCPAGPGTSVSDLAKRFGSQEIISKNSIPPPSQSKNVSYGKITPAEIVQEEQSSKQSKSPPTVEPSSFLSPTKSSFGARVFSSSRLPKNNSSSVLHPKASPITETTGKEVSDSDCGKTESTIPVSLTPTQADVSPPIRDVTEKGVCSYCCEPLTATRDKMILEDLQICSHTTCFKCEVCCCPLGDLQVGKSVWVLGKRLHCESCFQTTRDKWLL